MWSRKNDENMGEAREGQMSKMQGEGNSGACPSMQGGNGGSTIFRVGVAVRRMDGAGRYSTGYKRQDKTSTSQLERRTSL